MSAKDILCTYIYKTNYNMKIENYEIVDLIRIFYNERPENGAGGNLHIVFDDGNLEDKDILFCIKQAKEENDILGITIGYLFLSLPYKQRENIYANLWQ